jgi:hypothetical protein
MLMESVLANSPRTLPSASLVFKNVNTTFFFDYQMINIPTRVSSLQHKHSLLWYDRRGIDEGCGWGEEEEERGRRDKGRWAGR